VTGETYTEYFISADTMLLVWNGLCMYLDANNHILCLNYRVTLIYHLCIGQLPRELARNVRSGLSKYVINCLYSVLFHDIV